MSLGELEVRRRVEERTDGPTGELGRQERRAPMRDFGIILYMYRFGIDSDTKSVGTHME